MNLIAQKMVTIAVVDDHPFVHKGLNAVIELEPSMSLEWTSGSVEDALARFATSPVDVVIVDVKIGSSAGGIRFLEQLQKRSPKYKALVFSAYVSRRSVREAARFGANGYFLKTEGVEELLRAAERVSEGEKVPFLGPFAEWAKPNPYLELSNREVEVLVELSKGKSNPEVAEELGLKVGTVKTHLESIYRKLGVKSRTEAMRAALAEGYFYIDEIL